MTEDYHRLNQVLDLIMAMLLDMVIIAREDYYSLSYMQLLIWSVNFFHCYGRSESVYIPMKWTTVYTINFPKDSKYPTLY